jgi:hypothetical protein
MLATEMLQSKSAAQQLPQPMRYKMASSELRSTRTCTRHPCSMTDPQPRLALHPRALYSGFTQPPPKLADSCPSCHAGPSPR